MEVACEIEMIKDPETRKSNITYVARHIEDALSTQREYRSGCSVRFRHCLARSCCLWFGKRYGNYLICLYLIIKSLYIFNVVGQFFLMNRILGTNYTFYGLDLLRDITEGYMWQESGNFPRITMCDFEIRQLANKHRHTVQCVLPINMFNEKIFIFLWFWFVLVSTVNISSFVYWSYKSSLRVSRIQFIRKFLKLRDALEPGDKKLSLYFIDSYLRPDGIFILRLISQNAGELVASEIIERLWNLFKAHQHGPKQIVNTPSNTAPYPMTSVYRKGKEQWEKPFSQRSTQSSTNRLYHRHSSLSGNHERSGGHVPGRQSNIGKIRAKSPPTYPLPALPPPLPNKTNNLDGTNSSLTNHSHSLSVSEHETQMQFRFGATKTDRSDGSGREDIPKPGLAKKRTIVAKSQLKSRSAQLDDDLGDFV